MPKWEYKYLNLEHKFGQTDEVEEELNKLGEVGWEVVAGSINTQRSGRRTLSTSFVLKRSKQKDKR